MRLHLPDAPSGCPKRSEGGSPATARRTCVRCTPYKCRLGGASKRLRRRQPPPPPVRYTGIAPPSPHLLNRGRVFYLRGGGMVSSVVTSGTRSGASVFSGSALRVSHGRSPQRSKERAERPGDGCPCVGAEETCGVPPRCYRYVARTITAFPSGAKRPSFSKRNRAEEIYGAPPPKQTQVS